MEKTILTLKVAPEVSTKAPAGPSDEALMGLIKDRSQGALTMLYYRHRQTVAAVVGQAAASDEEREVLLKNVFDEIWNRAAFYSEESGRALGWIVTLARRCAASARPALRVGQLTLSFSADLTQAAA